MMSLHVWLSFCYLIVQSSNMNLVVDEGAFQCQKAGHGCLKEEAIANGFWATAGELGTCTQAVSPSIANTQPCP